MLKLGELNVVMRGDNTHLDRSLQQARSDVDTAGNRMSATFAKVAKAAVAAWATIGATRAIWGAIQAAAALEQSVGGVDAVFKENAATMHAWAAAAADSLGLSENAANEFAAVLGAQLKNGGLALDQVAVKTKDLVQLGADLSATYGGTVADAVASISAALKGEMDPIEKYGISLNAAMLEARALGMGITGNVATWTVAQKQQVIMATLYAQSTDAQGQFAAQINTTSEKQQVLSAKWENAKAALTESLLPATSAVVDKLADMAGFLQENSDIIVPAIGVLGGLALVIGTVVGAVKLWTLAQVALNFVLTANPIGLIIAAVGLLIVGIGLLISQWDELGPRLGAVWQKIEDWFGGLGGRIGEKARGMWDGVKLAFKSAINWVIDRWNGLEFRVPGVSAFGQTIPGFTLGVPDIPRLAKGGLIPATPGGRVFVAGEAGKPEIVSPEDMLERLTRRAVSEALQDLRGMDGATVKVDVYLDGEHLDAHTDARIIRQAKRTADWARAARPGRGVAL